MTRLNLRGQVVTDPTPIVVEALRRCQLRDLDQAGVMRIVERGEHVRITLSDYEDSGGDGLRRVR